MAHIHYRTVRIMNSRCYRCLMNMRFGGDPVPMEKITRKDYRENDMDEDNKDLSIFDNNSQFECSKCGSISESDIFTSHDKKQEIQLAWTLGQDTA